ncbi:sodium:solute symporter family protein [Saccharopolyspora oryzae]|uniref:Sodium:solute symporter family protein n=1 Tax=Saccharopolyspora oryzae TaxID=2997343 RepID=A0ABT4UVJ3_9PSEU|nr:sodium:solute symporter family protein [Saccharopolyspora oryzae]MDA3625739.1 sodium:solute symporter family protein [Saccharopolyspora oryzae]
MSTAAVIATLIAGSGIALGFAARGRKKMDLEQWTVAGRSMGPLLLWVLMAGEAFTTFTFLGAPGQAYAQGGPSLFILAYGPMAYIVSFFLLPPLWRYAKKHGLLTQGDYFAHRFQSRGLGALVAVIGVVFVVPYTVIQLVGLGDIVTTVTGIPRAVSLLVAFVFVAVFVFVAGIRSTAWTSALKDVLIIAAVIVVGVVIPLQYFGSFSGLLDAVNAAHPGHMALPGATSSMDVSWFISTVIMSSLGFYMYPQLFQATFTANSERSIRRNATFLPFYQLALLLVFFAGLTALMVVPGLKGAESNLALMKLVLVSSPDWLVGFIAGAGALAAMVPASALVLGSATLLSRNVYQGLLRPNADPRTVLRVSRALVLLVMLIALGFALTSTAALSSLLLTAYAGVSQFFPAVLLSLIWPRVSKAGVVAGILVGEGFAFGLISAGHSVLFGLNTGLVAMVLNLAVTAGVSLLTPAPRRAAEQVPA